VIWTFGLKLDTAPLALVALRSTGVPMTSWPAGGAGAVVAWIWMAVG
jgi:hypothetical protein